MNPHAEAESSEPLPEGWSRPKPEHLPEPTFWPAALSFGATFLVWGFVTSIIITLVGVVVFGASLAGWIADIRHERNKRA